MTPQELIDIAQEHGVDPIKLKVINDQGNLLGTNRIREKGGIELEMARELDKAAAEEQAGGYDESGVRRSPDDAIHRRRAAGLAKQLGPVLIQIAQIQQKEQNGEVAVKERQNLGKLLDHYKAAEDAFKIADKEFQQQREQRYHEAIGAAFTPVLLVQGFSVAEAAAAVEAITKTALEAEGNLNNNAEYAAEYAEQLVQAHQQSNFNFADYKPDANKVENAVCRAFNARLVHEDGQIKVKGQTPNFRARQAEQYAAEAMDKAGVASVPVKLLHEHMTPAPLLKTGTNMARELAMPGAQKNQASDTFRVHSNQPLDEAGAQVAFAKNQIGSRVNRLKAEGAIYDDVQNAASKDCQLLDTVAPLYGSSAAVEFVNDPDMEKATALKQEALGGDPSSLISRSVASSAVNKALDMNSLADEKIGLDENNNAIGVSVGVSGAAVFVASDNPLVAEQFLDIDYSQDWVQKGLSDLQVQDYITGQIDRHAGNIFIDPQSKQVKGIDNDLAFPVVEREEMLKGVGMNEKAVLGLPTQIHVDTASKIEALSPAKLRQQLESLPKVDGVAPLEPEAIDGAVERLEKLQSHVKDLRQEGKLINQFNKETYEQAKAAQISAAPDGNISNKKCPKASYLGTALVEQAVTARLNQSPQAYNHRKMVKEGDVKPRINEPYAGFQKGIQDARADLLKGPAKAPTPELAGRIDEAKAEIANLEKQLAGQDQDLQGVNSRLKSAEKAGRPQVAAPLRAAYQQASLERQQTLQALKAAQQKLDAALDEAVEPQKPLIAHQAAATHLGRQIEREKDVQAKLGPASERLEAAKSNLADARAADEAAWFEGKGPRTDEELAALSENLGAAEQELKDATEAHEQAVAELEQLKQDIPPLEKQVTANEAALQAMHPEGIPLSENIIWNPTAPSNKAQPPKVQLGPQPQDSQKVNALPAQGPGLKPPPGLPGNESVAENIARSRTQRPTLVRPPGPAPLPPGVSPSEDQQQGWKKVRTGENLHQGGESKPRVQRANSVGADSLKPAPNKKPESPHQGPVIGGGRTKTL